MQIPYVSGEWKSLFKPQTHGCYINDHTLIKDSRGKWHLFGITSFTGSPKDERYFAHGEGVSLDTEFAEGKPVIDKGTMPVTVLQAHAPEIIEENGKYYITTCGWIKSPNPIPGAVAIAPLDWREE